MPQTPTLPAPKKLQRDVPLAPRSSMQTGGPARYYLEAEDDAELLSALAWAQRKDLAVLILGGGSNLLCADAGFDGLVISLRESGLQRIGETETHEHYRVAAGRPWDSFVESACQRGLAGVECLSGIPGSVGATPIQNVGAYGQEVSDTILAVHCLDRHTLQSVDFSNAECEFAYRSSRFKQRDRDRYVVLRVDFSLRKDGRVEVKYPELQRAITSGDGAPDVKRVRETVLRLRRSKSMLLDPSDENGRSCGSFFVNQLLSPNAFEDLKARALPLEPPCFEQGDGRIKVPSAWLIQHAGFDKGHRHGNVGLSSKHTLCVVAHDAATSAEVLEFAKLVDQRVQARFGLSLQPEPVLVGLDWRQRD